MTGPLLAARIGSFAFHGDAAPVLQDIDLAVEPGTLTAVLGGSGSGKSTLAKLLAGWLPGAHGGSFAGSLQVGATPGAAARTITFSGGENDPRIDPAAWAEHVGLVPQDPAAILSGVRATVAEELAFGLETRGTDRPTMRRMVEETAARTGLAGLLGRDPATLSGGELRRLAVGCIVITGPRVLVLDEPLASLDAAGAADVLELIAGLRHGGTAIVVLSQSADQLARAASLWLVMDGGTAIACSTPGALLEEGTSLRRAGVVVPATAGAPIPDGAGPPSDFRPPPLPAVAAERVPSGPPAALELQRVSFTFPEAPGSGRYVLDGLELRVHRHEIVAVTGPNGAGKSTLLRHFNGLLRPDTGQVVVNGRSISGIPAGKAAEEVGLLFQHPRDQLFERTVLREVRFGLERLYGTEADDRARAALAAVGLQHAEGLHPYELPASGQRLLALATVLAREPSVLALDEPTVGLDRHGLERMGQAVTEAAARGAAVVLVTHDLGYAAATAQRILVLSGGRLHES
jgi:energy-coupling factor transport system ATP-binding protein